MLLTTLTVKLTRIKKKPKQKRNPSKTKHNTSNLCYTLQATKLRDWLDPSANLETPAAGKSPDAVLLSPRTRLAGGDASLPGSKTNGYRPASQFSWLFAFEQ